MYSLSWMGLKGRRQMIHNFEHLAGESVPASTDAVGTTTSNPIAARRRPFRADKKMEFYAYPPDRPAAADGTQAACCWREQTAGAVSRRAK